MNKKKLIWGRRIVSTGRRTGAMAWIKGNPNGKRKERVVWWVRKIDSDMHALRTVTLWSFTRWREELCRNWNERKKEMCLESMLHCNTYKYTTPSLPSRLSVVFFLTLFYCVTLLQLRPTLVHFIRDCSFCCLFFLWFILLFHHQNIQSVYLYKRFSIQIQLTKSLHTLLYSLFF